MQNLAYGEIIPFRLAGAGKNPIRLQIPGDGRGRLAFQVLSIDAANDFDFFGNDDEVSFLALVVSWEVVMIDLDLALPIAKIQS